MRSLCSGGLALVLLVGVVSCDGEVRRRAKKLERRGDAPPVVVVDRGLSGAVDVTPEVEPNDEAGQAMAIVAPSAVRAVLSTEADVDTYRISTPDAGVLSVMVSGVPELDLIVEVLDGDKVLFRSDRGGADVAEGFPNLHVSSGQLVVVRVQEFVSKSKKRRRKRKKEKPRSEPSPPYKLVAQFASQAGEGMETEPNAKIDGAKELLLGERGRGYIGWSGDVDRWRLSLLGYTEGHTLDLEVRGIPGIALTVEVQDEKGKALVQRKGAKGDDVFIRNVEPGQGHPFFVAMVKGNRSNPSDLYTVSASSRLMEPGDEIEPNDSPETATLVAEEGATKGEARGYLGGGDVDYLRLPAPPSGSVLNLELAVPASSDLSLEVAQGQRALAQADAGKIGVGERLIGVPVESGRAIDVTIRGVKSGRGNEAYRLTWESALGAGVGADSDDERDEAFD